MNNVTTEKPMQVLLIEDDAFDVSLTKRYLKKGLANYELHVLHDGAEALDFLNRRGKFHSQEKPNLILLDMGLPTMDGSEILTELKNNANFKNISVIVLTGRDEQQNSKKKFRLGENCYMKKWQNMGDFLAILKAAEDIQATLK
jgi:DNA-binding response OmpR family regulator